MITGLLIPEKDPAAIAEAVKRMVENRDQALTMAERGRGRVMEQFNPDQNHKRVLDLYIDHVVPRCFDRANG
ncbi:MAG: hypothetical protein FJY85_24355 [Deltaproteobacteria bacterium]|nr:hypothetical protein [Deltaproteobacteria bacterium]